MLYILAMKMLILNLLYKKNRNENKRVRKSEGEEQGNTEPKQVDA